MDAITYQLDSLDFYTELATFTDEVEQWAVSTLPPVEPFMDFVEAQQLEPLRSEAEYRLELLMLGVYWQNYFLHACAISESTATLCADLLQARRIPRYKKFVDGVRGVVHTSLLLATSTLPESRLTLKGMAQLNMWLGASGDFKEEVERLHRWMAFLSQQPAELADRYLQSAIDFSNWFTAEAKTALGRYTQNVDRFRQTVPSGYTNREDIILCNRRESEYHLIMVGAEIMNRALKDRFARTTRRVVLLPACMRPPKHNCQGHETDGEFSCVACCGHCEIGEIKKRGAGKFEIRVIVHASSFTRVLQKWQNEANVGLVASACVLHLFAGGYEMQKLAIPAQCVFLNHCGCKAHWDAEGIPTSVDAGQLERIAAVQVASLRAVHPDKSISCRSVCKSSAPAGVVARVS